ncbi:MAG: hypothetical protein D6746_05350 [Bacteroidetes bacterium]|nr:MAG: hypothetical protein D6746_05350 [Bacteroidota bacterium]
MRIERVPLSAVGNGAFVQVITPISPGQLIHEVPSDLDVIDVIHLWGIDPAGGGGSPLLMLEWGATGGDTINRFFMDEKLYKVVDGMCLWPGQGVYGIASAQINVCGYVDRIYKLR